MSHITYECWVCGTKKSHDLAKRHKPFGWKDKPIAGGVHGLCDFCAPHSALRDGLAGIMKSQILQRHGIKLDDEGKVVP